ncbi:hypothetical protein CEXT_500781 [Caerostris extrusa]|uniref:Uncharacterized protein n=1 Tax=Caerostris extrusa TaxID=172846 RepID=A0AAV4SIS1_CAEEX|nr:hypothetical protein CEXT_500781 [Caerostris extrusa]
MSTFRVVSRFIPTCAQGQSISNLMTAQDIGTPARTEWSCTGDKKLAILLSLKPPSESENEKSLPAPIIKVTPYVLDDGSCGGILVTVPLKVSKSDLQGLSSDSNLYFTSTNLEEQLNEEKGKSKNLKLLKFVSRSLSKQKRKLLRRFQT